MSRFIAITGKGGVGKTTVSALIVRSLIARKCVPVLAVDADPNTCLDRALGVRAASTIGRVREEARQISSKGMAVGIAKQQLLELKIAESLVEAEDFDLIAMGRPEGPGCYCYANNVLKSALGEIASPYPFVVLDNEAGLENLSRRIVQEVDVLVLVADPSQAGLETVERLYQLAREMEIRYHSLAIIINRCRDGRVPDRAAELKTLFGARFQLALPDDGSIAQYSERGESLLGLSVSNPVLERIDRFLEEFLALGKEREEGKSA